MKGGMLKCECGKEFYFETVRNEVACIDCGKVHDVSNYPVIDKEEIEEVPLEEGE